MDTTQKLFVIWHEVFAPHLNTHDRWREGESNTQREKEKERQRQLGRAEREVEPGRKKVRKTMSRKENGDS